MGPNLAFPMIRIIISWGPYVVENRQMIFYEYTKKNYDQILCNPEAYIVGTGFGDCLGSEAGARNPARTRTP